MFTQSYNSNSQSQNSAGDEVKFYSWGAGPAASAGIIALAVTLNGQTEYLQFCPKSMVGVADRSPLNLIRARAGDFIESLENTILIEGLRRSPELYDKKTFYLLGDNEKLKMAQEMSAEVREKLIMRGQPTRVKILKNLNVVSMLHMIQSYKSIKPQFVSLSGLAPGEGRAENCASIILKFLDKGAGYKNQEEVAELLKRQFLFTLFVVASTPLFTGKIDSSLVVIGAIVFSGLRFLTGYVESMDSWDNVSDLLHAEGIQDLPLNLGLGVHAILMVAYRLIAGFASIIIPNPTALQALVLPQDVVDQVNHLVGEELDARDLAQAMTARHTI